MGFVHESHGPHEIGVEQRGKSFYIHPAYGYDVECPTCHGDALIGTCVRCGGSGRVDLFADEPFGAQWRNHAYPEFLLEDVPDLIRALADLPTCPPEIRAALEPPSEDS